jgi:hypothetical protein
VANVVGGDLKLAVRESFQNWWMVASVLARPLIVADPPGAVLP